MFDPLRCIPTFYVWFADATSYGVTKGKDNMNRQDGIFFPKEKDEIIARITRAVQSCPITTNDVIGVGEVAAAASRCGIHPQDILQLILHTYPHHADEIMKHLTTLFDWEQVTRLTDGNKKRPE